MTGNDLQAGWDELKSDIIRLFGHAALEDGIGYYEAEAIDSYMPPGTPEYLAIKAKDERTDWMKLFDHLEAKSIDRDRFCFMDGKGLRFCLPVLMLRKDNESLIGIVNFYIDEQLGRANYTDGKFTAFIGLLDNGQRELLLRYFKYMNSMEYPGYTDDELHAPFDLGEIITRGFNYMAYLKDKLLQ